MTKCPLHNEPDSSVCEEEYSYIFHSSAVDLVMILTSSPFLRCILSSCSRFRLEATCDFVMTKFALQISDDAKSSQETLQPTVCSMGRGHFGQQSLLCKIGTANDGLRGEPPSFRSVRFRHDKIAKRLERTRRIFSLHGERLCKKDEFECRRVDEKDFILAFLRPKRSITAYWNRYCNFERGSRDRNVIPRRAVATRT